MDHYFLILFFFILNFLIIIFFDKIKLFHHVVDYPDTKRKFHKKPTYLAGGAILITNLLIYFILVIFNEGFLDKSLFYSKTEFFVFLISSLFIFSIGTYDDKYNLKPLKKFALLLIVLSIFIHLNEYTKIENLNFSFYKNEISIGNFSTLFTLFCFMVFINAFNMFDGINLQISSYSLIILLTILLFYEFTFIFLIITIYLIFFSYLNYKNESFLGDSGSLLLAFLIGFFFIKLNKNGIIENADKIFIFMILPGIDMIRLFFERIFNKKNPLSYDRNHIHHLLLKKNSFYFTILIINFLIIFPILTLNLVQNNIYIIISYVVFYSLLVNKLKN